ncbi:hypothetical protein K461DRAFT_228550 [Myriangium duriaei CBS 260.36]|uniref:Zn(2)-C6 fungal-type domain-containing protein n=1 Tax=Myriangium duriaei CBS 260.36 TaxID=1168546 RepID=A0A9P4IVZ1_9PEZI|nr:hypothetical protein K461DRAFT_228550 [Myriangium duriaei CBS 260.36]
MASQANVKQEDIADDHDDGLDIDADHDSASGPASPGADDNGQDKPSAPMQKRRRVTRACDECRRKKIKCDGKQPCTHCTVYSYDCTYDQPSNRRRNPVPAYVEALEARVHLAEGLIQMIAPNLDLNDPALEIAVRHGYVPGLKSSVPNVPQEVKAEFPQDNGDQKSQDKAEVKSETDLESMIRAVGQIEMDENGNWDYHGHSSGLSFVKRMREQLGDLMGPDTGSTPFVMPRKVSQVIDSPRSTSIGSPMDYSTMSDLPPEHVAKELCEHAINRYSILLKVVHVPSFWRSFKRIYSLPAEQFTNEDYKFTLLLYSTLALGTVYGPQEAANYEGTIDKAYKYFRAARQMMDMADIRDLTSIQAVVLMIMFLQSSARLTQCYSYIGVAMRAALRMGLHRSLPSKRFNPVEAELRKRVFWTLRKLDVYTGAILGLPSNLSDDEIDQDYPAEVEDDYITEQGIIAMPSGTVSMMTAFNLHTRLVTILTKIVKTVYPIRLQNGSVNKSYTVPFSKIRDIEQDLETWKASLPPAFDPSNVDPKMLRAQQSLRVTYAFNQVLLYRPFLHFVEADKGSKQTDQRAYACAASYIHVCRNLVHLIEARQKEGMLMGSLWFIMYTTFFSILSLVYFAAENPDNPTTSDLMKDALTGKKILASAAKINMSADRCTATLDLIFSRLPEWMREGKPNPAPKRKRKQAPDSRQGTSISQGPSSSRAGPSSGLAPVHIVRGQSPAALASSSGPFTPQGSGFSPGPFTPTDYSPTTQTLAQFGLLPQNGLDVPDLSSIFSSAEPFSYPNQPLTTFENNQTFRDPSLYGGGIGGVSNTHVSSMTQAGGSGRANGDTLEAQFYGGLPPFVMQGNNQWSSESQNTRTASTTGSRQGQSQRYMMPQNPSSLGSNWPSQQNIMYQNQGFPEVNLNDIFGGPEWSGSLMNQNYGL